MICHDPRERDYLAGEQKRSRPQVEWFFVHEERDCTRRSTEKWRRIEPNA
jgi:hypothetical protein